MKKLLTIYYRPILILILFFAFFTRINRLNIPERYIFDEVYHVVTAKLIARNDPRAFEWWNAPIEPNTAVDWLHPPLAKYTQAFFIKTLGENSFAWRLSSVIFGTMLIALVAKLADQLFDDKRISLLAALLASLDGLLLVQSRIAMNDIHVTFFILLTLIFYQKRLKTKQEKKYLLLSIISAGLAMASKWSGIFILIFIGGWELIKHLSQLKSFKKLFTLDEYNWFFSRFVVFLFIPLIIYISSYSMMFLQGKTFICNQDVPIQGECYFENFKWGDRTWYSGYVSHFVELHKQIFWYQTHLEATHTYQSRPFQWFLDLKPVWFHVDRPNDTQIANIYSFGNPLLFWIGDVFIFVSLIIIIAKLFDNILRLNEAKLSASRSNKIISRFSFDLPACAGRLRFTRKIKTTNFSSLIFILVAYFIVWLPWQFSPRIMFFYHYTPAVPLLSINLAYWLIKIADSKSKKITLYPGGNRQLSYTQLFSLLAFGSILLAFIIWYPHWTAIPMPKWWVENVYFFLKSWQ